MAAMADNNNIVSSSVWKDAGKRAKKSRKASRKGTRRGFPAWELTILAPGGWNPPAEDEAEAEAEAEAGEVVVVGQGECELAFGS